MAQSALASRIAVKTDLITVRRVGGDDWPQICVGDFVRTWGGGGGAASRTRSRVTGTGQPTGGSPIHSADKRVGYAGEKFNRLVGCSRRSAETFRHVCQWLLVIR